MPGPGSDSLGPATFSKPRQSPGTGDVRRLALPGQGAENSRGGLAEAQERQRRLPRPYRLSARGEAIERGHEPGARHARRGIVTCTSMPLLPPPSFLPSSRTDLRPPGPALLMPRLFRRRRRGESGPGRAHARGGGEAATPAGSRALEDCAGRAGHGTPQPLGPGRKPTLSGSTWLKRAYVTAVGLGFFGAANPFEHL